jgi:3-demethoxyubiquinol 3-hydroxylase
MSRTLTPSDHLLAALGRGLAMLPRRAKPETAAPPATPADLDPAARAHVAGLMRVNHAGEIAAQALYHGQALVSRDARTRAHLLRAAQEEREHLELCAQRLRELGDAPSRLGPLWYAGSFAIGATAGLAGDQWSLGFVEETERQVSEHLSEHLERLPPDDARSRAILERMRSDEQRHGREAAEAGARPLPEPVRQLMRGVAAVMKFSAYRI